MNLYKIFLASILLCLLASCESEEPERSSITNVVPFKVIEANVESDIVSEDEASYSVGFKIDENLKIEGVATISVNPASTATEDVDFHLQTKSITLNPWETDYSFIFDIYNDVILEGDETIILDITTSADPFFSGEEGQTVTITIEDFLTPDLYLTFDWDVSFVFDGDTYTTCPFVDLDVYVLDADGNDLGIYDAATGACPEQIIVDSTWDDGVYYLASNMWDNATLKGLELGIEYTMTMSAYKQGKIDATYVPEDQWLSEDDDQQVDMNAAFKEVAILTKAGDVYTIEAPDGTLLGSGLTAPRKVTN